METSNSPTTTKSDTAPRKLPEGTSINWLTMQVDWPYPTWVENELYNEEFQTDNEQRTGQLLVNMLNNLQAQILKALATAKGDVGVVEFEYWRKIDDAATKLKPAKLKATLYEHPQYNKAWLYVERA